jgi:hypothetical protein
MPFQNFQQSDWSIAEDIYKALKRQNGPEFPEKGENNLLKLNILVFQNINQAKYIKKNVYSKYGQHFSPIYRLEEEILLGNPSLLQKQNLENLNDPKLNKNRARHRRILNQVLTGR